MNNKNDNNLEENFDNDINNIDSIIFKDNTAGVYLDISNTSKYYQIENLIKNLKDENKTKLHVIVSKSSKSKKE